MNLTECLTLAFEQARAAMTPKIALALQTGEGERFSFLLMLDERYSQYGIYLAEAGSRVRLGTHRFNGCAWSTSVDMDPAHGAAVGHWLVGLKNPERLSEPRCGQIVGFEVRT